MRRFFGSMGSISRVTIESQALKSNMLDDSSMRVVDVYVPTHDGQGLPLIVDLVGFTSSGLSHTNWVGFATAAQSPAMSDKTNLGDN
jgi:hypothetical protein